MDDRARQWALTVAGLLHDVGKFRQRTGKQLPEEIWNQQDVFCPLHSSGEYHTHLHAVHTYYVLRELQDRLPVEIRSEQPAVWAAKHHVAHTFEEVVIEQADWLSSGADRAAREYDPQRREYWAVAQRSVFDSLGLAGGEPVAVHTYGLGPADPDHLYPHGERPVDREQYTDLWERFMADCRRVAGRRPEAWLEAMLSVMERYCWCVPSSTMADPDVSLLDHAVTTAAFATALFRYHQETDTCDPAAVRDRSARKFLLVSGDVSGIQQYIFDLRQASVKGAAKLLRARSFEIQLLTEAAVRFILARCDLPPVQNIMSAGGRFLLLLPDVPSVVDRVTEASRVIEQWCLRHYQGQLSVIVARPVPAAGEDFVRGKPFQRLYRELEAAILDAKQRKHQRALRDADGRWVPSAAVLDEDYDRFREANTCRACGVRPTETVDLPGEQDAEAVDIPDAGLCAHCQRLKAVGQALPHAERVAWTHSAVVGAGGRAQLEFFDGEVGVAVLRAGQAEPNDAVVTQWLGRYEPGAPHRRALHFLPRAEDGEPLTFADMAEQGRIDGQGVDHLAMLKMDVDGMSTLFRDGLGDRFSISRYVTLSRMLDTFFSICLHRVLQEDFPFSYTVFAGGDDLCVIGPWERTVDLAVALRERFRQYTGDNRAITLSAGLALAHQRLPVPVMAAMAEEQLDLAKAYRPDGRHPKDVFGLFDVVVPWERWDDEVRSWRDRLDEGMRVREQGGERGRTGYSRGLVRSLFWFREQALAEGRHLDLGAAPWRAHLRYMLARNIGGDDADAWRRPLEEMAAFGQEARERWHLLKVPVTLVLYHHRQG